MASWGEMFWGLDDGEIQTELYGLLDQCAQVKPTFNPIAVTVAWRKERGYWWTPLRRFLSCVRLWTERDR